MADKISEGIKLFAQEKGLDDDLVVHVVQQSLKAAYKKQFGTDSNIVFSEKDGSILIFSKKIVVESVRNKVTEIPLKEALKITESAEAGDELLVEIDPMDFGIAAAHAGKQRAIQCLREIQKDSLYSEYSSKIGEIIIGYFHREMNGNIYVDLGKVEGLLPKRFQSPHDRFGRNSKAGEESRIKALVKDVKKHRQSNVVQLILSRTDSDFVRRILELEVPEIYNGVIEIRNIVREAGYRTKVAVAALREEVDPVGACVGPKGARIQAVIAELGGEKIDVLEYSDDPRIYIRNSLLPAEIEDVVIIDEERRSAVAIVSQTQLSLAVGKQGMNVRLANRLADWNIVVKTEEEFKEMDIYTDIRQAAENLFAPDDEEDVISTVAELPGITEEIVAALNNSGIDDIQDLISMDEAEIRSLDGLSAEMADELIDIIANAVEVVEDGSREEAEEEYDEGGDTEETAEVEETEEDEEEILCPECNKPIKIDMAECPHCGVGLSFEYYEDEE